MAGIRALGLFVAEALGRDGAGFGIVAAAIGFGYIGAVAWYRWRS